MFDSYVILNFKKVVNDLSLPCVEIIQNEKKCLYKFKANESIYYIRYKLVFESLT